MENGRGDRFRYDEEGQLIEAWYNAANPATSGNGYTRYDGLGHYDALGNRYDWEYISSRGWMNFTRKDNGLNQYWTWLNNIATSYDDDIPGWGAPGRANGVLMQEGNITAGYNALNQPTMMQGPPLAGTQTWIFFGYDPLGRCVRRWTGQLVNGNPPLPSVSTGGTYFYYDGWNVIEEGATGSASRNYVHGARVDEIVKQLIQYNPAPRYFHYDARGHCVLQTDANGNIAEQYEYDAFGYPYFFDAAGNPTTVNGRPDSPWGNRFLFTGREWLSDLKLYDYRNRMYQPELGRFLQPDPKQFTAGDYNLYRYCHNDPVNNADPTGLDANFQLMRDPYLAKHNPRLAAATMRVFENGKFKGAVRVNENGFHEGRQGIPGGHYLVLPKREDGERFLKGTPAVTSPSLRDQPGATAAGHKEGTVLMHGEGAPPDSDGCLTLKPAGLKLVTDVFNRNKDSTTLDVSNGPEVSRDGTPRIRSTTSSGGAPAPDGWIFGTRLHDR